ncbi:bifunctional demethylmenaquinone methyltransferase/2-methoxy-6-polyprenyl-1,4-benzoquinol methylase UbiE [Clostridium sp. DJ247]|uniref:bifunctional demethylmenaquinone methyltransferase/2-methoxy-6-polyprenyl-1,4-benzoquinol methylase UbiE n=1 Tax=Clostridium sp. DJ247 TaxID=2726188 RepID=UPI00162655DA|nr:bifunctional demethylmenaquinone methyltransferase/2-methoxy-6-polyprenyl-1,4-benzoquinol methylase UbiE [Clostridium sp. DJ247]MBC2582039.1 bifunctional demethylmenaquinone methyltransferase/2-methoxy-6-polyprenyl-1,4-benzoquinol methylase UbiE [Clostridium sp. DJ247]
MRSEKSNVQNIFSAIAEKYDVLNTVLTLNIDRLWRKKAINISNINKNHKVLDLCCGTGQMMYYACKKVGKDTEVIGIDFNEDMLNVGYKRLCKSINNYKFKLLKGDVQALPFNDCSFDCVTIAFGLRNIPDKAKALSEIYRVLKPGGKAVCLELSTPQIPVFKQVYGLYFNYILPIVGYLGTGSKSAYFYLRDSVNSFMTKTELNHAFNSTGFSDAGYKSLSGGIASIHYGTKPIITK